MLAGPAVRVLNGLLASEKSKVITFPILQKLEAAFRRRKL